MANDDDETETSKASRKYSKHNLIKTINYMNTSRLFAHENKFIDSDK